MPDGGVLAGTTFSRAFPGHDSEIRDLRRWLAPLVGDIPARDDVITVASELGTNAVRHTRSGHGRRFAAELTWLKGSVRIAVADLGALAEPRVIGRVTGESGRGLLVVAALASHMGVLGDHRGRLVWAEIADGPDSADGPDGAGGPPAESDLDDLRESFGRLLRLIHTESAIVW